MKNKVHQIDRNDGFRISSRFTAILELVFVFTKENPFS